MKLIRNSSKCGIEKWLSVKTITKVPLNLSLSSRSRVIYCLKWLFGVLTFMVCWRTTWIVTSLFQLFSNQYLTYQWLLKHLVIDNTAVFRFSSRCIWIALLKVFSIILVIIGSCPVFIISLRNTRKVVFRLF